MKLFIKSSYIMMFCLPCIVKAQTETVEKLASETEHTSLLEVFREPITPVQKEDPKLFIEALTTWRSEYVYRGFDLAESSFEAQLAGQYIISDSQWVDFGIFYGSATGSGDFSEYAAFIEYSEELGEWNFSAKLKFNEYNNAIFRSGASADLGLTYQINDEFALKSLVSYDTGADGLYSELKLEYYEEVNSNAFVILNLGVSATHDYYDSSGFHHVFSQLSYTYNVNESVSLTPYIAASLALDDEIENSLLGGVYFSVGF